MPSKKYRRKLRNPYYKNSITYIIDKNTDIYPVYAVECESELVKTQNYFYKILDMIIQHNDFTIIVSDLQNIIKTTQSIVDYYKIIDIIEKNLISVVCNISDNINPGIIQSRIDYIKSYIDQLPPGCMKISPISDMLLEVINSIINSVDFSIVTTNINNIQKLINKTYGEITYINHIQDNILSIICNISDNTNSAIISERVQYLKEIISDYKLFSTL